MNRRKVPQLFVGSGASKWSDCKKYPWTMGWQPSYRTEAQIYAKYILANVENPRLGILYQNDDFGKDYPIGVKDILGDNWDKVVAKSVSYETTDATVNSQIAELQGSGANVLLVGAIAKFAAQSIRKVYDLAWNPIFFMSNVSSSVGTVMQPAGPEKAIGLLTTAYIKDPTDAAWNDDPAMQTWRQFMAKYIPDGDTTDAATVFAYAISTTMLQVLKQCKGRLLPPERHARGGKPARQRKSAAAAWHPDQHQRHGSPPDQGHAVPEMGRPDLGPLRRPDRRRQRLSRSTTGRCRHGIVRPTCSGSRTGSEFAGALVQRT